jgi:formylglycine-generating enzyme required for sulfatase activity
MDEIPAGTLLRGSPEETGEEDETPIDEVFVPAFYIDRYEVTNADYARCVESGLCRSPDELDPELFGAPRQPVVGVGWHDAMTYCRWSGKRLPTEVEWERAARGDDSRVYPWGDEPPSCELAVFVECDRYGPAEVGGRPAGQGPFGTQDLAGNVWEWVHDWYAPRHFPAGPEGTHEGPPAGRQRVLRGGSWHFGAQYIRAANRHRDDPEQRAPWYGFRCAYRPPPPPGPTMTIRDAGVDHVPAHHGRQTPPDADPPLLVEIDSGVLDE